VLSRIAYILRETGASLKRNLTLTLAALLTVVATLSLLGFSLLIQGSVGNLLAKWRNGVQIIAFMQPSATQEQIEATKRFLDASPLVKHPTIFVTKEEAQVEFKRLFPDSNDLTGSISLDQLPTSYRISPVSADDATLNLLADQLNGQPGVDRVTSARDVVAFVRTLSSFFKVVTVAGAAILGSVSVTLIWNTIRTAMFARRREIEVMKLVGATNWFIRWPFVLEGMIQGLVGAVLACIITGLGNSLWKSRVIDKAGGFDLQLLQATSGQFTQACVWMLVIGVLAGALASAVAATRFLDV
jgi:cell division transport system permease protein